MANQLRKYLYDEFPIAELRKLGMFKGLQTRDYEGMANRICEHLNLESIYDYAPPEMEQVGNVINGKFPDRINKKGDIIEGEGFHLSIIETRFTCPICTCKQTLTSEKHIIKCKGCKRKLNAYHNMHGELFISEHIDTIR